MMIPLGEGDLPLVLDFTYFDDAASLNIWGDSDSLDPSGDGWWLPPTEEGLEDSCWVCDGWSVNLLGGGGEDVYKRQGYPSTSVTSAAGSRTIPPIRPSSVRSAEIRLTTVTSNKKHRAPAAAGRTDITPETINQPNKQKHKIGGYYI